MTYAAQRLADLRRDRRMAMDPARRSAIARMGAIAVVARRGRTPLTDAQKRAIRASRERHVDLARRYGVSAERVRQVRLEGAE